MPVQISQPVRSQQAIPIDKPNIFSSNFVQNYSKGSNNENFNVDNKQESDREWRLRLWEEEWKKWLLNVVGSNEIVPTNYGVYHP